MSNPTSIAEAIAAERERIASILRDPISHDRRQAAEALAFETAMSAADAISLLATLEAPKPAATGLGAADAPGGLVATNPDGSPVSVQPGGALVRSGPSEPATETPTKRLWKSAIAGVNGTAAKPANAG